jgi:hypothetical protein
MDSVFISLDKTMAEHTPETKKKIQKVANEGIKFHTTFSGYEMKCNVSSVPISPANSVLFPAKKHTLKELSAHIANFEVLTYVAF